MKTKSFTLLLAGITALTISSVANACTGICLNAVDGSVIYGRTGEFGVPLDIRLILIPKGITMDGGPVKDAQAKVWTSKYRVVGVNTYGTSSVLDGLNEAGLHVGGFYFPDYAQYSDVTKADDGNVVAPINFVNYLLTQFSTIQEIRQTLQKIKISGAKMKAWGDIVPPFHWIATDRSGASIVIEPVGGKLLVYDNPLGVITNSPTFDWHITNLRNFIYLNPLNVPPRKIDKITFKQLGQGSGLAGMPGDFTPPSRFVRAVVYSQSAFPMKTANDAVYETFHILNQFDIPKGAVVEENKDKREAEITQATIVADLKNLKYYVHNYYSRRIKMIDLQHADLSADKIIQIDLPKEETIDNLTP